MPDLCPTCPTLIAEVGQFSFWLLAYVSPALLPNLPDLHV